jgi:hypothetical protein
MILAATVSERMIATVDFVTRMNPSRNFLTMQIPNRHRAANSIYHISLQLA